MRWTTCVVLLFLATFTYKAHGFGGPECLWDNFQCSEGQCTYKNWVCDGNPDCSNSKDEENCGGCEKHQFACNNGTCIHHDKICNRQNDCSEGEDEANCGTICYGTEFECKNGQCISGHEKECDGNIDCSDGSDESHCGAPPKCPNNEFSCSNGSCIKRDFVCDNEKDCPNGEDEVNCTYPSTCSPGEVRCSDDKCASSYLHCYSNPMDISPKETKDEKIEQCLLVHGCVPKIIGLVFGVLGLVLIIAGWSIWFYREKVVLMRNISVAQAGESNYRRLGREAERNPPSEAITMDDVP